MRTGGSAPCNRARRREQEEKTVLCVQDGSSLNFAKWGKTEGLRVSNQTGAKTCGLHPHATLNTERLPLGVLRAAFDAPQLGAEKNMPREKKKSYRPRPSGQCRGGGGARQRAGRRRPDKRTSWTCSSSSASACRQWNSWCGRR